jgi:putative hemolysin
MNYLEFPIVQLTNAFAAYYTNPASTVTYWRGYRVHNTQTSPQTVKVCKVPNAGTASEANEIDSILLEPGESIVVDFPASKISTEGVFIAAKSTDSESVTIELFLATP